MVLMGAITKATETVWGSMYRLPVAVTLGHGWAGQPAAKVNFFTDANNSTALAFDDPAILRDIAADLLKAAEYMENEPPKEKD